MLSIHLTRESAGNFTVGLLGQFQLILFTRFGYIWHRLNFRSAYDPNQDVRWILGVITLWPPKRYLLVFLWICRISSRYTRNYAIGFNVNLFGVECMCVAFQILTVGLKWSFTKRTYLWPPDLQFESVYRERLLQSMYAIVCHHAKVTVSQVYLHKTFLGCGRNCDLLIKNNAKQSRKFITNHNILQIKSLFESKAADRNENLIYVLQSKDISTGINHISLAQIRFSANELCNKIFSHRFCLNLDKLSFKRVL